MDIAQWIKCLAGELKDEPNGEQQEQKQLFWPQTKIKKYNCTFVAGYNGSLSSRRLIFQRKTSAPTDYAESSFFIFDFISVIFF